jgi:hypothetical protein
MTHSFHSGSGAQAMSVGYKPTEAQFPTERHEGATTAMGARPLPPEDLARRRVSQKSAVFRQSPHPVFTVRPIRSGTVAERGRQMSDKEGEG